MKDLSKKVTTLLNQDFVAQLFSGSTQDHMWLVIVSDRRMFAKLVLQDTPPSKGIVTAQNNSVLCCVVL